VVFASAAACTLGVATLPVYEIYKVEQAPRWLDGLDLVAAAGLRVAVIPHYDNNQGGTHSPRYCYMGDEHTARRTPMTPACSPTGQGSPSPQVTSGGHDGREVRKLSSCRFAA